MDRKPQGTHSPKSKTIPKRLTAFEISVHPEYQKETPNKEAPHLKAGDPCPKCQSAKIDYDSMLNLSCVTCGYTLVGCFT